MRHRHWHFARCAVIVLRRAYKKRFVGRQRLLELPKVGSPRAGGGVPCSRLGFSTTSHSPLFPEHAHAQMVCPFDSARSNSYLLLLLGSLRAPLQYKPPQCRCGIFQANQYVQIIRSPPLCLSLRAENQAVKENESAACLPVIVAGAQKWEALSGCVA